MNSWTEPKPLTREQEYFRAMAMIEKGGIESRDFPYFYCK
jgi:hypothetical protein